MNKTELSCAFAHVSGLRAMYSAMSLQTGAYALRQVRKGAHDGPFFSQEELAQDELATLRRHTQLAQEHLEHAQSMYWLDMRNAWALRAPIPTDDDIRREQELDRAANPHNEPYQNKRPRRGRTEIISDRMYGFADEALLRQHGKPYREWLDRNTEKQWGFHVYTGE
jgi:hypothetical protein